MRAVRLPRAGNVERSSSADPIVAHRAAPDGATGSSILVRVAASSINGSDLNLRLGGVMGVTTRRVQPGFDMTGTAVACGPRVSAFEVGDRVMALLPHSGGGQAELVAVDEERAARVPDSIPDAAAAAIPLAGLTALQALRDRGGLQPGTSRRVLVNGAAGGIGSFAVQLASLYGAHVTAITSGDRGDYLTGLGADEVVDRHDDTWRTSGARWDLVLDVPSAFRFRDIRPLLNSRGVLVSTRPISTDALSMLPSPRRRDTDPRYSFVTTAASSQDLAYLARLVEAGRLSVPLDGVFPLYNVAAAYRQASGSVRGKVVIEF